MILRSQTSEIRANRQTNRQTDNVIYIVDMNDSYFSTDSSTELNGLVEDKEVAARAVAFVVNSTRKGIVPLCADVGTLLRAKRRYIFLCISIYN